MSGTTALEVRRLRAADAPFVQQLATTALREYAENPGPASRLMAEHFPTWIALRGEQPQGFITLKVAASTLEIVAIAVIPGGRGRGVGAELLPTALAAARAKRLARVTLHTADSNVAALELFLKQGFVIRDRIPRYYAGMYTACALVREL